MENNQDSQFQLIRKLLMSVPVPQLLILFKTDRTLVDSICKFGMIPCISPEVVRRICEGLIYVKEIKEGACCIPSENLQTFDRILQQCSPSQCMHIIGEIIGNRGTLFTMNAEFIRICGAHGYEVQKQLDIMLTMAWVPDGISKDGFEYLFWDLKADPNMQTEYTSTGWDGTKPRGMALLEELISRSCTQGFPGFMLDQIEILLRHPRIDIRAVSQGGSVSKLVDEYYFTPQRGTTSKEVPLRLRRAFARFRVRVLARAWHQRLGAACANPLCEFAGQEYLMRYIVELLVESV